MKVVEIDDCNEFYSKIKEFEGQKLYVYLYGSNQENGESWCIDCRNALEKVKSECNKVENSVLVLAATGSREAHRKPDNFYKIDSTTKVQSIPTLINWKDKSRLVEAECADNSKLQRFFQ
jgi:hypothetical protein